MECGVPTARQRHMDGMVVARRVAPAAWCNWDDVQMIGFCAFSVVVLWTELLCFISPARIASFAPQEDVVSPSSNVPSEPDGTDGGDTAPVREGDDRSQARLFLQTLGMAIFGIFLSMAVACAYCTCMDSHV